MGGTRDSSGSGVGEWETNWLLNGFEDDDEAKTVPGELG